MKKLTNKLLLLSIIVVSLTTPSCIKETGCTDPNSLNYSATAEIDDGSCIYGGCTDPESKNYDPNADVNDGSCTYEGSVVFWYGETTSMGLMNDGATSLTYYVDGRIVGSSATNVYWAGTTGPDCGTTGSITVDIDLGKNKTQTYAFSIIDQIGWEYYEGVISINANRCNRQELGWSKKKKKQS